jgi:hypothetical protein
MNDTFFGRLADLIAKPARLMENVGVNPRWWQPGLLVFVLICVFSYLTLPISAPEQLEMMRDSKLMQMMPEDQWQQQYDEALNLPPAKRLIQSAGAGFTTWVMVILFSLTLGFFARMSGGKGTFRQALGLGSWSALIPFGVGSVVKLPLVLATESVFTVNIGLAALLPGADPGSPLYQVLMTYGDLFTWWGLGVLIIGYGLVFNMSRQAAAVAVILPWILLSAIPLGLTLLFM